MEKDSGELFDDEDHAGVQVEHHVQGQTVSMEDDYLMPEDEALLRQSFARMHDSCAHCGKSLKEALVEKVIAGDILFFCSEAHAKLGKKSI